MLSRSAAVALLLCFISITNLGLAVWKSASSTKFVKNKPSVYTYKAHDYPMMLPLPGEEMEDVLYTVEETIHYALNHSDSDDQWFSLTSAGWGYARFGPDNRIFMVTMFHEMHCLRMLAFAYSGSPITSMEHIRHCLGYLRQTTLCSADTTLEPGDFTQRNFEWDRTGATHVCRDWSAVYPVMEENYRQWMNGSSL